MCRLCMLEFFFIQMGVLWEVLDNDNDNDKKYVIVNIELKLKLNDDFFI